MAPLNPNRLDRRIKPVNAHALKTRLDCNPWDAEIARTTQLFFEADRLDDLAYAIIGGQDGPDAVWERYSQAKKSADTKRTEAYQDWMRIRHAMQQTPHAS